MCHMSPTAQVLGLLVSIITSIFAAWHIWCFDRGRCLLFTRRDVFRWTVLMMLVAALCCFLIWSGMLSWVKYQEYYGVVPLPDGSTMIRPVPWQFWSTKRQKLIRAGYHIASVGWGMLVAVHAEETLYWAYLIGSIRNRDSRSWFRSKYFKLWLLCVVTALCVEPGVACIETTDLNKMEHHIFFAGSILAVILFVGSLWLLIVFPGFIKESRRQGANPEVLGRLQYFKELNSARTVFRFFYALCLSTLSIDAWTAHKSVNMSPFWTDVTFTLAYVCALTSTAIGIMILLPRSMAGEAGAGKTAQVFVQQHPPHPSAAQAHRKSSLHAPSSGRSSTTAYPASTSSDAELQPRAPAPGPVERTLSRRSASGPLGAWSALGERLNIDSSHLDDIESHSHMEMERKSGGSVHSEFNVPFAAHPDSRRLAEGELVPTVPRALNDFRGTLAVNSPRRPVDLNIVVVSETIVEKD